MKTAIFRWRGIKAVKDIVVPCDVRSPDQQERILCGSTTRTTYPDPPQVYPCKWKGTRVKEKEGEERKRKTASKTAENDRNAHG
jgi:hypothetical protein